MSKDIVSVHGTRESAQTAVAAILAPPENRGIAAKITRPGGPEKDFWAFPHGAYLKIKPYEVHP